jgi:hypothetical protein
MINSVTYVSLAKAPISAKELQDLLKTFVASNARVGVTGMLLYKNGCFMQVTVEPRL